MNIEVNETFVGVVDPAVLERAAQATLDHEKVLQPVEMSIRVSDDTELHKLNKEFLGMDGPTDVLSFPADEIDPETGILYLGDIAISLPRATEQASLAGHAKEYELELLVVHGTLHLLGYDHAEPDEKQRMWAVQSNILAELGSPITDIPG